MVIQLPTGGGVNVVFTAPVFFNKCHKSKTLHMKKHDITIEKSLCLAEVETSYKTKVKPSDRPKIGGSLDCYNILKDVFDPNKIEHIEEFIILCLNRNNKLLGWAKISTGGVSGTVTDPKVIFQIALNANASGIILSHNHPSGNLKASNEDIQITKRLKEAGKLLDIQVLDHIIITQESYVSLADQGEI